MAYDIDLAQRIASVLDEEKTVYAEKKMFGGVAFMISDKMCVGVSKNQMMLRTLDEEYEHVLQLPFVQPMEFTGRRMNGFVFIQPDGLKTKQQIKKWVSYGLEFGRLGIVKSKIKKTKTSKK